jgi:cytochrome oxidase Cu insertion factor (SCO1/SenC/PrrC family)
MRRILVAALCALALSAGAFGQTMKKEMTKPLAVGDAAPDFTLSDQNGKSVTLSAAKGKSPVVLVFYRGYW